MTDRLFILLRLGLAVAIVSVLWCFSPYEILADTPVPENPVKSQPPIRVIQVLDHDRMIVECEVGAPHFLARGGIERMKDGRWLQNGVWTNYWAKGTVSSVGEWKDGVQVGPWLFTSEDGRSTVTNHPPFTAAVAVAQQTVPATIAGSKNEPGLEVKNAETRLNQSSDSTPSPASDTAAAQLPQEPIPEVALWAKKRGDEFFLRGKYREAFSAYEEAEKTPVKNDEFAASVQLQKGLCRFKEKRTSDASSIWSRLRAMYSQTTAAPQSLLLEAEDPSNTGKLDRYYDEILAKHPKSDEAAMVLQKRGQVAFEKKDYAKASEWWGRFVSDFPNHAQAGQIQAKLAQS